MSDDFIHLPPIPAQASLSELRQWCERMRELLVRFGATQAGVTSAVGEISASDIPYDNSTSGLSATNVQDALDELEGLIT